MITALHKVQILFAVLFLTNPLLAQAEETSKNHDLRFEVPKSYTYGNQVDYSGVQEAHPCLLYTSPSPRDATLSRMPSSA